MPKVPHSAFVEERDAMVISRRQVVEVFMQKRESVKANDRLKGLGELPILLLDVAPNIAELERLDVAKSTRKSSVVTSMSKGLKAD